jgi:Peptidase family C25
VNSMSPQGMAAVRRKRKPAEHFPLIPIGLALSLLGPAAAQAQMATGSYVGDGTTGRQITGLSFAPDAVLIKADATAHAVMRTSTMGAGNVSKDTSASTVITSITDRITSLDTNGFTVGTDTTVNANAVVYYWTAWSTSTNIAVAQYSGDGTASQAITGLSFSPDFLIILPAGDRWPMHRTSLSGTNSFRFSGTGMANDAVTSLDPTGFSVSNSSPPTNSMNVNGEPYHYIAFNAVAGFMAVGSYTGDGVTDNRAITPVGFQPQFVLVTPQTSLSPHFRTDAMVGDVSYDFQSSASSNMIQQFLANGFEIGTDADVATNGTVYDWVGFTRIATAVGLSSFEAQGFDAAVELSWTTASELNNLGFHLDRSLSADGPFDRITSAVMPGLGCSASGQSYSYRDAGLTNGVRYYYKLEDIDTRGPTTLHGPVSATPTGTAALSGDPGPSSDPGGTSRGVAYGDPSTTSLSVLERDSRHVLLELRTGGFFASPNPDGSVDIDVPTFETSVPPGAPALPSRGTWIDAVAGRKAVITSVQATDSLAFAGLRPAPAGAPALDVARDGTVRPGRVRRSPDSSFRGLFPRTAARVLGTGFQQETKKVHLELAPLRWNASSGRLLLARRLLVRLDFTGVDPAEISLGGSRGRRPVVLPRPSTGAIQLLVRFKGLYKLTFEDIFPRGRRPVSQLRVSRRGESVPFFLDRSSFGPGASLYFLSDGAGLNPNGNEAVYELTRQAGGLRMNTASASPSGTSASFYWRRLTWEQNKTYQAGLLDAPDLWLWEALISPVTKSYPFSIDQLVSTSATARLSVHLQGGSDFEADPDHHIRISVNGTPLAEASWNGMLPKTIEADVTPGVLLEGQNTLQIENVGDTRAAYSLVFLDRFSLSYPRALSAVAGVFDGTASESGSLQVTGFETGSAVLDTTGASPVWLTGAWPGTGSLTFRAETGRSYLAVSPAALLRPEVKAIPNGTLRSTLNCADYLVVGPRDFLAAAKPLTDSRQSQGLRTMAVAIEDVYDQFGFGEAGTDPVKAFIAYAYHFWQRPSPRYVLLLGDATYDPKDFLQTGTKDRVPTPIAKTTYIWTASDPSYALVNGDDLLPDLAIGRLPAANLAEAQVMVQKVLAFEAGARDLSGPAVLVADNADVAGPFEANADDLAQSVLAGHEVEKIYVRDLAAQSLDIRTSIRAALDNGASLLSYVGHGSIAVWASENVWNNLDVATLQPQAQQPVLLTLDCLNGFFHFPPLNSLAEQMVKAEGRGAVAAVSPSGLSLDSPAHVFHKALLQELLSGKHARLGDALLAAQSDYAQSGYFPELLSIYHLFGDPAMKIR